MTYLDRRHYQLLIAIRRHGQLSLAARALGLTQPGASHQLHEAERRLGIRLFDREGRSMKLTAAGERLLDAGLYAENTLRTAEFDAVQLHRRAAQTLRFGIGNYDHLSWLAPVAGALGALDRDLKIELIRLANRDLPSALLSGSVDLFIAPQEEELESLASTPLFEDRLVGVFPPSAADVPGGAVAAQTFEALRYLAFQYHPAHGFEYERFFQPAGIVPRTINRVESVVAILTMVSAGYGVSILPAWCVADAATAGRVVARELSPGPIDVRWSLYGTLKATENRQHVLPTTVAALRELRPRAGDRG